MPDIPASPPPENPQNKNIVILVGIVLLIIVMGGLVATSYILKQKSTPSPTTGTTTAVASLPNEFDVTLGKNGFEPQSVKIKAGGAVRWTNTSGVEATVNSDDHPNHQKYKELNLGTFVEGSTLVHIFNTPGTYTYHDHFHPEKTGTVVVE